MAVDRPDAGRVSDDMALPDAAEPDAAEPDAARLPTRCSAPPDRPAAPTGPRSPPATVHRGVDAWESGAYAGLRSAALGDPGVHFVATWDHTTLEIAVEDSIVEVVDHGDGAPVAGVTVSCAACDPASVVTDEAGRAVFTALQPPLELIHPRYNTQTWPL